MALPSSGPLSLNDIQGEFGGTNPIGMNEYYAGGGLVPSGTTGTFGAVPSSGALSVQNFYGTSALIPVYIEELFSTWLYEGTGAVQTITNGIDLAGSGGMVWAKNRGSSQNNLLFDTIRGANSWMSSNTINGNTFDGNMLQAFNSNGFRVGTTLSASGNRYTSWSFREQPKFFDVVRWTGNGNPGRQISHTLGSVPGCILVKTEDTGGWAVWHRGVNGGNGRIILNTTAAASIPDNGVWWGNNSNYVAPTSTNFTVSSSGNVNDPGVVYVAYVFAHDAGGFGLTGTDNVISCGSYTGNGSGTGPVIDLGYEPQWLMIKAATRTGDWFIVDNMRGFDQTTNRQLFPNLASPEDTAYLVRPTATGFQIAATSFLVNSNSETYIYVAVRRGPMKVPTTGTSVFTPLAYSGNGANRVVSYSPLNVVDLSITGPRVRSDGGGTIKLWADRVRGRISGNSASDIFGFWFESNSASEESGFNAAILNMNQLSLRETNAIWNGTGSTYFNYGMARAPSFMDIVCYTGTGANRTVAHNLAAVPELMIVKKRSGVDNWFVYSATLGNNANLVLSNNSAVNNGTTLWNTTTPTASVFSLGTSPTANESGFTFVMYLFASCPGVSKVGSYTGTGDTQVINCGFTTGARFVMVKATNGTGDWYFWDSARGIVAGNDPYLAMNNTTPEVTGTDWVDTATTGFELSNAGGNLANSNGTNYIFLAIA